MTVLEPTVNEWSLIKFIKRFKTYFAKEYIHIFGNWTHKRYTTLLVTAMHWPKPQGDLWDMLISTAESNQTNSIGVDTGY